MRIYSAILEVEAHANGGRKDIQRYLNTLQDLRQSAIKNHAIIGVIATSEDEPTRVKHYGFDYHCKSECPHEPVSYGVLTLYARRQRGIRRHKYLFVRMGWLAMFP